MENFVINCYRLAERFSCDPAIFLAKPFSQISRHLMWVDRLNGSDHIDQAWQDKLNNG